MHAERSDCQPVRPGGGRGGATAREALRAWLVMAALVLSGGILSACHLRPILSDVSLSPASISPNADGVEDATRISYTLSRNALVSVFFERPTGERFYFRQGQARSAGDYQVLWGGVIHQPYWLDMGSNLGRERVDSWVLPDGVYRWVIEATDEQQETQPVAGQIVLAGGDATVPELQSFGVTLPAFSPNQDGLDDRTGVSYSLNRDVDSVQVYLYDPSAPGVRYPLEEQERATKPGKAGYHYYDYDGGVDNGADPPPDGQYVVSAEAQDSAGHHVAVSSTLTILEGGQPRANVVQGTIHWQSAMRNRQQGTELYIALGARLVFTTYVENYGTVPIRTSGPPPGTCYRSDENSNTLAVEMGEESWHEQAGVWRFGVNFDVSQTDFPYRWAIGTSEELRCEMLSGHKQCFLDPGKRGTVTGCIELAGPFPRPDVYAWGGLIHEWVGIKAQNNYVDRVMLHIGGP